MTRRRATIACPREPIGLGREEAAVFIGVSPAHFMRLVQAGKMPVPFDLGAREVWDAEEVSAAFHRLPRKKMDLNPGVAPAHDDATTADEDEWRCRA